MKKMDKTVTCEDVLNSAWNPELQESIIGISESWEHVIPNKIGTRLEPYHNDFPTLCKYHFR